MSTARILVVEDNPMNSMLVRDILQHRGHEVLEAATIEAGRAMLRGASIDLVLMDVEFPGGGGVALLREIRDDPSLAQLPIVAVTALAMRGDRERLVAAGFDGYISKPIDTRAFGPTVEAFLRRLGETDAT